MRRIVRSSIAFEEAAVARINRSRVKYLGCTSVASWEIVTLDYDARLYGLITPPFRGG